MKRPFVPLAGTTEMRARIRELASPERDDFDRAVLILLDDFERLLAFYETARPWDARREEREACARHIEARACQLRDNGPTTPEGLLTALAGAQVGALLDAAASLRNGAAEAIHQEIISPELVEYALEVWRDSLLLKTWSDADRMKSVLAHVSQAAIDAVLARRLSEAARSGPWPFDKGESGSLLAGANPGDTPAGTAGTP